jgi:hypothetical protein
MFVIIPRTVWRLFIGAVFLSLAPEVEAEITRQFIVILGTGIMLGSIFGLYRAVKVLFADSEEEK